MLVVAYNRKKFDEDIWSQIWNRIIGRSGGFLAEAVPDITLAVVVAHSTVLPLLSSQPLFIHSHQYAE
jgi:hypothetical protein